MEGPMISHNPLHLTPHGVVEGPMISHNPLPHTPMLWWTAVWCLITPTNAIVNPLIPSHRYNTCNCPGRSFPEIIILSAAGTLRNQGNKQTENSWFADQRLWRQCQWREQMETFLQIALGPRVACESRNSLSRIVQHSRGPWVEFTTRHQIELPVTVDKMMHASVYFTSWLPYTLLKNAATGLPRAANKHVSPRTMCET